MSFEHDDVAQPKVGAILIFTEQFQEMLRFYRDGLGLAAVDIDPGAGYRPHVDWVALGNGGAVVELFDARVHRRGLPQPNGPLLPAIVADDVRSATGRCTQKLASEIAVADWGTYAYVRDPDGHLVQVYSENPTNRLPGDQQ